MTGTYNTALTKGETRMGITREMMVEKMKQLLRTNFYLQEEGGEFFSTIYKDQSDEICDRTIADCLKSDHPYDRLMETMWEWEIEGDDTYDLLQAIKKLICKEGKEWKEAFEEYDMQDWFYDNVHAVLDYDEWDRMIPVSVMVDSGNWNYDCVCDDILNYCNYYSNEVPNIKSVPDASSVLWLAKQQGKEMEFRNEIARYQQAGFGEYHMPEDRFVKSCIQELINLPSHMATLTFMVSMPLYDFLKVKSRELKPEKIVVDKRARCGLFAPWDGGGSILEIELDKDVEIPFGSARLEFDSVPGFGYGVMDVYGLCESFFNSKVELVNADCI